MVADQPRQKSLLRERCPPCPLGIQAFDVGQEREQAWLHIDCDRQRRGGIVLCSVDNGLEGTCFRQSVKICTHTGKVRMGRGVIKRPLPFLPCREPRQSVSVGFRVWHRFLSGLCTGAPVHDCK